MPGPRSSAASSAAAETLAIAADGSNRCDGGKLAAASGPAIAAVALATLKATVKPSVLGAVSGAVAGLVVITPGSGYLDQTGAFICGLTGGPVCYLGIKIKNLLGFDDALDAFGVHGIGGIWGGILTGILANPEVSGGPGATCFTDATDEVKVGGCVTVDAVAKSSNACGAAFGNAEQIGIQLLGIVVTTAVITITAFLDVELFQGLHVCPFIWKGLQPWAFRYFDNPQGLQDAPIR